MQTNLSSSFGNRFTDALKGGPGSGNWGHAGRPGAAGGSAPQGKAPLSRDQLREFGSAKVSAGRLDKFLTPRFRLTQDYHGLKDAQKAEVLKAAVGRYQKEPPNYVKVAELPAGASDELKRANSAVGATEAIRNRALGSLAAVKGDEVAERKILHSVVKLQELAQRESGVRQDLVARGVAGPEVRKPSKPVNLKEHTTPEGTLRAAVYGKADDETKTNVMRVATATYRSGYKPVATMPEGSSPKAVAANRMVGALEGIRSAIGAKLADAGDDQTAERKILHAAFNLQRDARRFARIRDLELGGA